MKNPIIARVLGYLAAHQGKRFTAKEVGAELELGSKLVSTGLFRLSQMDVGIKKVSRGVWVYSPHEPIEYQESPGKRLFDLLQEGPQSATDIARKLGIPKRDVATLVITMRKTFKVKTSREITYKLES